MTPATLPAELARVVAEASTEELPRLIGDLEAARAAGWARLTAPRAEPLPTASSTPEELLTPEQAAETLGVNAKWLYRHTKGLRFRRNLSRKVVRFERAGLLRWMAAKRT